jgi:hypothetical protein
MGLIGLSRQYPSRNAAMHQGSDLDQFVAIVWRCSTRRRRYSRRLRRAAKIG